jgi:hypothetical protein
MRFSFWASYLTVKDPRYVNDVAFESWYSAIILETERLLDS